MTTLLPSSMQPAASHAAKTVSTGSSSAQVSSAGSGSEPAVSGFSAVIRQVVSDLKTSTPMMTHRVTPSVGNDRTGTNLPVQGAEGQAGPGTGISKDQLSASGKGHDTVMAGPTSGQTEPPSTATPDQGQLEAALILPVSTPSIHVATSISSKVAEGKSPKADKKTSESSGSAPGASWLLPNMTPSPLVSLAVPAGSSSPVPDSSGHQTGNVKGGMATPGVSTQQVASPVAAAISGKSSSPEQILPASSAHVAAAAPSASTSSSTNFILPMGAGQVQVSNALHPTQAAEVHVQTPVTDSQFASALGQHLLILAGQQVQTARLHVSPPELGPIAVEIRMQSHDQVSVSMVVSHASTHEVLSQSMGTLHDSFAAQGMQLQTSLSGGQGQGQGQQAPTREEWLHSTQAPSGSSAEITKITPLAQAASSLNSQSLLDLYA